MKRVGPLLERIAAPNNLLGACLKNHLLAPLDHYLKEELHVLGYVRYMDDFGCRPKAGAASTAAVAGLTSPATAAARSATAGGPGFRSVNLGFRLVLAARFNEDIPPFF